MSLKNKKVLVTGAGGFIGSHLVDKLLKLGIKTTALCKYNSMNSWGWLNHYKIRPNKNLQVILGDIRDENLVDSILSSVDIVFHLAALIGIPYSYIAPKSYLDTNITGTMNVLNSSLRHRIKKVLITSTSEVYGSAVNIPMSESHILQAQSPYSASKISADKLAESYFKSFNLPVTIVRPFNTYGPRQSERAIIPTVIGQILNNQKKIELGNLSPFRDFNYVSDTINGFIEIAKSTNVKGETINICSNQEIQILDIVKKICEISKHKFSYNQSLKRTRKTSSEVNRLLGDNTKIKSLTNWKTEVSLDKGLKKTILWFKKNNHLYEKKNNSYIL